LLWFSSERYKWPFIKEKANIIKLKQKKEQFQYSAVGMPLVVGPVTGPVAGPVAGPHAGHIIVKKLFYRCFW
jgi:hypothetical protein